MTRKAANALALKQHALAEILRRANVMNEDGQQITDFQPRGRDSQDFASVSRATLQKLLDDAYRAGQGSK